MDPVTVSITVGRPREEVFEYLADIANHPEFSDHYLDQWRLTRKDTFGQGAGARFHVKRRFNRFAWADTTFVEVVPPHRIVGVGRGGKYNRIRSFTTWTLSPAPGGGTRVELTVETEPKILSDRLVEGPGFRGWWKRRSARALRRLRTILEEGGDRGQRATIAGL